MPVSLEKKRDGYTPELRHCGPNACGKRAAECRCFAKDGRK